MKHALTLTAFLFALPLAFGQDFGSQQVITVSAGGTQSVYATDLDGDGDADVLSASLIDDKIAWYENLGGGSFGSQQVITLSADSARSVYATDLDGDGDADVLSASWDDDKIAWYENLGGGSFGSQQWISLSAAGATSVYATDLDGDGDADVLSASYYDYKIAWYENIMDPPCFATNVCLTSPNSVGAGAVMIWSGSTSSSGAGRPCRGNRYSRCSKRTTVSSFIRSSTKGKNHRRTSSTPVRPRISKRFRQSTT